MALQHALRTAVWSAQQTKGFCEECQAETDVEALEDVGENQVMCLDCGSEFELKDPIAEKYKNYVVAVVTEVETVPKKDKLKTVKVNVGSGDDGADRILQVVTNAKHVETGNRVVVACPGAIVPAGASMEENEGAIEVKAGAVGGIKSEAMLCDCPMLGWTGGAAGVLVKLDDTFAVGSTPPATRPRKE